LNLGNYLAGLTPGSSFRIVIEIEEGDGSHLAAAGFTDPESGQTILPSPIGPVSRFNADGRWDIHRDQPKESRYVRTVLWRWEQWAGRGHTEEHEGMRDIYRDCFPRAFVPPPSVEMTYTEDGGRKRVVSEVFRHDAASAERIKHAINLFLELFGRCDLANVDLTCFSPPTTRRVNWRMLPPGEYPWARLKEHLDGVLHHSSEDTRTVIWDRQENIRSHNPAEICIGLAGFRDHLAYSFPEAGLVVLESVRRDNAVYVFGLDWERFSQLTKAEILDGHFHLARIVHSGGWKRRLAELLAMREAAE
jgi:hypothetical protein